MKTIIYDILKALCSKIMYKICPWKRKAFILLKLDKMTPDQVDYVRKFLNCIYEYPSAFQTDNFTPAKDDLAESLQAINKYVNYKRESTLAAIFNKLYRVKQVVLHLFF